MSYISTQGTAYYSSTPPAPPPKPPTSSTPQQGPPLPPPPPSQTEPQELDGTQDPPYRYPGQHPIAHPAQTNIPTIEPGWLPDILKDKSTADLHAVLDDPALQAGFLDNPSSTHPAIPASQTLLQTHLTDNTHLASSVAALEAQLIHLRTQTQGRLLSLRALEQQHRTKLTETEGALQAFSPMALYQRLNAGVLEQEQVLRGLEESWLDDEGVAGEREVGEFLRRVKEAGKVAFLRRERRERWDEGRVGGWR